MRKISSFLLMAAALLIGTQAQAVDVSNEAGLRTAIYDAADGATVDIKLMADIDLEKTIQIYSPYAATGKQIYLDLNGHKLSNKEGFNCSIIELFKGTLNVTGKGSIEYHYPRGTATTDPRKDAVIVHGVFEEKSNWSNLTIGKDVKVLADKNAITIMEFTSVLYCAYIKSQYAGTVLTNDYNYNFSRENVAASFYAKNATTSDSLCVVKTDKRIKLNDDKTYVDFSSVVPYGDTAIKAGVTTKAGYRDYVATKTGVTSAYKSCFANGVNVVINGYVKGDKYGIKVNGNLRYKSTYMPSIYISETAKIQCSSSTDESFEGKESIAIYCSGQAKWKIEGNVSGNIGVVAKAGEIEINNATIEATGEEYEAVYPKGSGVEGGAGTGILVDSHYGYSKEGITLTISGDTKVSGGEGYAINEVILEGSTGNVSSINIEGGTFQGGKAGAIAVTPTTVESGVIEISGAIVSGDVFVNDEPSELDDLVSNGSFVKDMTIGGEEVVVVTKGGTPSATPVSLSAESLSAIADSANVTIDKESILITTSKVLGYVEMDSITSDTIASGVTLRIGKLVMGDDAQLVVLPGAKLIIYGEQGIVAGKTSNIVIKADATGMGTFLFNPAVTSNRTPMATLEFYTETRPIIPGDNSAYKADIMVSPFAAIQSLTNNQIQKGYKFDYRYWNGTDWTQYSNGKEGVISSAKPFEPIVIGNSTPADVFTTYTFTGQLQGNISGKINLKKGFNYIGNAFVAGMDIQKLMDELISNGSVEPAIWTWDFKHQNYITTTGDNINKLSALKPLGFFVLKAKKDVVLDFNYEKLVWDYNK